MDDFAIINDYAKTIKQKLIDEVNGYVRYEAYPKIDVIIFKISFKEFEFCYALNEVKDKIYNRDSDDVIDDIIADYRRTLMRTFIKSESRKIRDKEKKLGIYKEDL